MRRVVALVVALAVSLSGRSMPSSDGCGNAMAIQTIYRQTWQTMFSRPEHFQANDPGNMSIPYDPVSGYPEIDDGAAIKVVTPGTLEYDDSVYGADVDYAAGVSLHLGAQIADSSTYWDQRGVTIEVSYRFKPLDFAYGIVLALAQGNFSFNVVFLVEYSANKWWVSWRTPAGATGFLEISPATGYTADNALHRFKFEIQPGTVTGDPLGSHSVAEDGYWRITLDNVVIGEETDIDLVLGYTPAGDPHISSPVHVSHLWLGHEGLLGPTEDLHLYREGDGPEPVVLPIDTSDPCCAIGPDAIAKRIEAAKPVDNPYRPLQPWTRQCTGSGIVPQVDDLTDPEQWL